MLRICQRYEYEFGEGRDSLNEIVDELFPRVEAIFESLSGNHTEEATIQKFRISKIMSVSNSLHLCN